MVKKKDEIPDWVTDEIQNAKFEKPKKLKISGYVLEMYQEDNKIDTQLYEPVEDENRDKQDLYKLFDEVEIPMEMDKNTKNFICKKCGLYASREQVSDIRYKLNKKERTRDDKSDDYLEWWNKSKKDKNLDS